MLKRITSNLIFMSEGNHNRETVITIKYINAINIDNNVLDIITNNRNVLRYVYRNKELALMDERKIAKGLEKYFEKNV